MNAQSPSVPSYRLRGELLPGELLAQYTTWGVGGAARQLYRPADIDDLAAFVAGLPVSEPLFWLGLGSNLLVRDGGFAGTVVLTAGLLSGLEVMDENRIYAEAGVACPKVARFSGRQNLHGAEFLAGIPGTLGGALMMNAGAFGGETWDIVQRVETLSRAGRRQWRSPADYRVGYRSVKGPAEEYFIAAELGLKSGAGEQALERVKALLRRRNETQPTGLRSCGSVFRNPPGDYAARLIEACELKGERIGGAVVSDKHANFIINQGQASASDIEALIQHVVETVQVRFGVSLQTEVRMIGEPADEGERT